MEYNGHIYCIICLPTEKWYFGQTVGSISDRWIRHLSSVKKGSDHKFHRAIRKYGEENFLVEEVMFVEAPTKDALKRKLDFLERYFIQKFDTKNSGYNSTDCGDYGTAGMKMSEEAKKKISEAKRRENLSFGQRKRMSESKMGKKNPFYHKTHSEDSRKRISEAKSGDNHHFFGKKMTEEHRRKLSEAQILRRNKILKLKLS